MTEQSYKLLAAKRLAIDPAELLMYFIVDDKVLVTTPDGKQHIFTMAELTRPAKKNDPGDQVNSIPVATKPVDRQLDKPKSVAKPVSNKKRGGAIS